MSKKGFTLVELLAVIVVLAIVMGIAAIAITNILESTRKNAFIASAQSYISGAKSLVKADEVEIMMGGTATYAPKCSATVTENTKTISLTSIRTEGGDNDKSSYGNTFDKSSSFVKVVATPINAGDYSICNYTYSIYLTDGTFNVGTSTVPIAEVELDSSDVVPVSGG